MNRYFLIFGAIFLFLGACNFDDLGSNTDLDADDSYKEKEDLLSSSLQKCQQNLRSVTWTCNKAGVRELYLVDQSPSTVDDEGTVNARQRICELHRYSEPREVIAYAHYQKDHCVKELNKKIREKKNQGFECTAGREYLDDTKPNKPCVGISV